MWDDRCVVMGFVEGFSCIFQGLDIFFRLDGDSQFKGLGFQVPAAFHLLDEFVGFGALVSANDDDRDTAQVDGLTGDVVDVIFVEAAFDFNGVDEGRTDGKAQDRRVVVIGLVHFRQLALIAREEDRRLFGITGNEQQGVPELGQIDGPVETAGIKGNHIVRFL